MATEFNPTGTYWKSKYVIVYENAQGKDEEFYSLLKAEYEKVNLPNTRFGFGEFALKSSLFGSKGSTKMYCIKSDEFKTFELWYRATVIGNMLVLRMYEFGTDYPGDKNIAGTDSMTALEWLGNYLFYKVIAVIDPEYKDRMQLHDLKRLKST